MGSLFTGQTITDLKADLRRQLQESGHRIVAEATSPTKYGESMWYVAITSDTPLPDSVVAFTPIIFAPTKGRYADHGAGYKDQDEFMGPVRADGVTKKFLAALTPLPEPTEGEPQSLGWAREWRKRAAEEAEKAEANRAFVKTLRPGSTFMLPGRKPNGPFTVTSLNPRNGSLSAQAGPYNLVYRVTRTQLACAVPVQEGEHAHAS